MQGRRARRDGRGLRRCLGRRRGVVLVTDGAAEAGGGAAASGVRGVVSAVGVSSGAAGDGVPSGCGVSSVMVRILPGSTLPTLMVVGKG